MPSFIIYAQFHQFQIFNKFKDLGTGMCTFQLLRRVELGKKWRTDELSFGEEMKIWWCRRVEEQLWACDFELGIEIFRWGITGLGIENLRFELSSSSWWEIDLGIGGCRGCLCVLSNETLKQRRFDFEPGTARQEGNRGVPAGISRTDRN